MIAEERIIEDAINAPVRREDAARNPATFGEIASAEFAAAGLSTLSGVNKPFDDAFEEARAAASAAAGRPLDPPLSLDRDARIAALRDAVAAAGLDEERRKSLDSVLDVRGRAADKAAAIEREAADVAGRTYGLSAHALGFAAGIARHAVDPVNLATLPLGGPLRGPVLGVLAREFGIGFGIQAAQEPFIQPERAALGLDAGLGKGFAASLESGIGQAGFAGLIRAGAAVIGLAQRGVARPRPAEAVSVAPDGEAARVGAVRNETPLGESPIGPEGPYADVAAEDLAAAARLAEREAALPARPSSRPSSSEVEEGARSSRTKPLDDERAGGVDPVRTRIEDEARIGEAARAMEEARPAPVGVALPQPSALARHRVVDAAGRDIEVEPVVVEASDLVTSSDAGFDPALQPRDRDRAASQLQIRAIAGNLDPQRLGFSAEADRGAPIVGPDNLVESGNGRVLAIRAALAENGASAERYREFLRAQGVDVAGFKEPVLVRRRVTALSDARRLDVEALALLRNPDNLAAAANRDFVRAFVRTLPQAEQGALVNAEGGLSAEGLGRIRNAVIARAYGDASILARIAEAVDDDIKSVSNALIAVAPEWARLRADIAAGAVRADVDPTAFLVDAVKRVADLRARGGKLDQLIEQVDAFDALPGPTEAILRMFYMPDGKRAASQERIAFTLLTLAEEARKVSATAALDLGLPPLTLAELQATAVRRAKERFDGGSGQGDLLAGARAGDGGDNGAGGGAVRRSGPGGQGDRPRRASEGGDRGGQEQARPAGEVAEGAAQQQTIIGDRALAAEADQTLAAAGGDLDVKRPGNLPSEIPTDLFRGSGREDFGSVFNPAISSPVNILGEARYFGFTREVAEKFGPNIETATIGAVVKNPLVVTDDGAWRRLTKEAGWPFPNPFGRERDELIADIARLRSLIEGRGHDGVVVWWNDDTKGDITRDGKGIKLLRNVFGDPQVVDFRLSNDGSRAQRNERAGEGGDRGGQEQARPAGEVAETAPQQQIIIGDRALAAEADQTLAAAGGDLDIVIVDPTTGAEAKVSARAALSEAAEFDRAADELARCAGATVDAGKTG